MSITLKWTNPAVVDEVQVFRSDTPLAAGQLPVGEPVIKITDKTAIYVDNNTVQNKYYYYILAFKTGDDVVYAPQSVAINMPYTGPGPQTIQCGTWERGFFGQVAATELFSNQEIQALIGIGTAYTPAQSWLKMIWKGKILFVPMLRVIAGTGWNQLYLAGCMYGVSGPGPATGHGLTPTDQLKVISKGDHDFILRTPRACSTLDYSWNGNAKDVDGEWINMVASCYLSNNLAPALDLADYTTGNFDTSAAVLAEFVTTNAAFSSNSPGTVSAPSSTAVRTSASNIWRPILELVL